MATRTTRSEKLDIRLTPAAKRLLSAAATAERRSVSDFVLESAIRHAHETMADRRAFSLGPEQWNSFIAALDAPPRDLPRLRKLLNEPGIFSRKEPM